jgi:hypothetical protein
MSLPPAHPHGSSLIIGDTRERVKGEILRAARVTGRAMPARKESGTMGAYYVFNPEMQSSTVQQKSLAA